MTRVIYRGGAFLVGRFGLDYNFTSNWTDTENLLLILIGYRSRNLYQVNFTYIYHNIVTIYKVYYFY